MHKESQWSTVVGPDTETWAVETLLIKLKMKRRILLGITKGHMYYLLAKNLSTCSACFRTERLS